MKKFFFFAFAAVVALAACTKNTLDPVSQEARKINFSTVTGKATKAPINDNYFNHENGAFGVYAAYLEDTKTWDANKANSSLYMGAEGGPGVSVTFDNTDNIWKPVTNYYWPLQGSLTFFAYWPFTLDPDYDSSTYKLTFGEFNVNTTIANQVDVLVSDYAKDMFTNTTVYSDGTVNSGTVKGTPILFKHMLSQIVFRAKASNDVYAAGMSFKINAITVGARKHSDSWEVIPGAVPVWSDPEELTAFSVFPEGGFPTAASSHGSGVAADYLTNDLATYAEIGAPLLMIPNNDFNGENDLNDTDDTTANPNLANDDEYFTVKYTLYRMSDGLEMGNKTVKIYFNENIDTVTKWEAGKKYTYQLTIDLEKIYFSPTVDDWTQVNEPVAVPQDQAHN